MAHIDRHPLVFLAYQTCLMIERCGASPELTDAVTYASRLMRALDEFIEEHGLEIDEAEKAKLTAQYHDFIAQLGAQNGETK